MIKIIKGLSCLMAVLLAFCTIQLPAQAAFSDVGDNQYITTSKISTGRTGKSMSITIVFKNSAGRDLKNVRVGFSQDVDLSDDEELLSTGYTFPFEVNEHTFDYKTIGSIKDGSTKSFTLSGKVRRDISEGYYTVPIKVMADDFTVSDEYINLWISKSTGAADDGKDETSANVEFALGEGQETPFGVYPNVMNFGINVRNDSQMTAYDVNVSMNLSKDTAEFPFEINDANYDRHYDQIGENETVSVPYSMAIRKEAYSGYYPIKFTISYRESQDGTVLKAEPVYFVRIQNKDKEDDLGDFNANDRTKARIVVDSFETIPKEIIAGSEFELILRMKNASTNVPATNILFSLESEKFSDSAVFSTESGSSAIVVNELAAGQTTELRVKMQSKAGVDQRSYAVTVKEKYDSPEFKNAEESVSIDIPVRQIARLNTGTIEIMPDSITVGSETNVMFGINNTGRVQLYNVMAKFEADSIQTADTYVGNIKPGDTGNVDIMITGAAPTADDGKVKITISYEDENGEATSVEKEMTLFVTEDMPVDMDASMMDGMGGEDVKPSFFARFGWMLLLALTAAAVTAVVVVISIRKKKKQQAEEKEDMDDEIS